jgi:hypothetical protein
MAIRLRLRTAYVGRAYLEATPISRHRHAPNVVTAVLASYRGFDTLGRDGRDLRGVHSASR